MTVAELIKELKQFDGNRPVELLVGNNAGAIPAKVETFSDFNQVYITDSDRLRWR